MSDNNPSEHNNNQEQRTSVLSGEPSVGGTIPGGTNNGTGGGTEQQNPGPFDFGMNPAPSTAQPNPPTQNNHEMESLLGKECPVSQPPQMGSVPQNLNSGPNIGSMPNSIPGMSPQIPQNPTKTSQGPTKSHLAEILGAHEMNQLQTMARPLDHQNPAMSQAQGGLPNNNPPTQPNRPNPNPEMMGMRPNHGMPNMGGGGFNPNMASYQHMFQGMPPGGPGMPPGHFRYPNPRGQTDFRQNPGFNPGAPPVNSTTPPMVKGDEETKGKGGRKRRPSSRKNSRDGDDTTPDGTGRKRKRGTKDDSAGGTKSTRKRKPKGSAAVVPEGSLLMFSTQMLNEASQEVLKKKKNATMVDYHQSINGTNAQPLSRKMNPTTPPIPSGMAVGNLPGARPSLQQNNNHRQSPANDIGSVMSPSHIPNVMSPHNRGGVVPGRVPTPHDGRMTPGSIHSGVGRVPTPGGGASSANCGPQSPAQNQDIRIPTPNAPSPATSHPPCPSPGANSHVSMDQEGKLKDTGRGIRRNPSPSGQINQMLPGRSPSQGGTPSPGPNHQGANPMVTIHPNNSDQQQMINSIKMQQHQQRQYAMMHRQQFPPHPHHNYPPHMMPQMHPSMRGHHYGHHGHPSMRHPRYPMDPSRFPMHPGMHPRMGGFPGMQHPGMPQHPGLGQMTSQRMRFQGDQSGMGNPNMGPGGTNYYSEQLRQKALASSMGAPPNGQNMNGPMGGGPPGMGGMGQAPGQPGGPPGMGGPGVGQNGPNFNQRFQNQQPPGGGDQMMTQNGNFNNQNSNGPLRPNGPGPGGPGGHHPGMNQSDPFQPNTPNSVGGGPPGQGPNPTNGGNSYPPANSPGAYNHQNGPGHGLMSPMGSQVQNQPNPQSQQPPPPGQQNSGQPNQSSLVNLLHSNSADQQSPYQNQAKSPASQMNGNIMSPTPSQPPGGPPSIAPSIPEFAPTTPSGPPPLSPAHTNPMTPVSHVAPNTPGGQNDSSFGPMTPSGVPNQAPMTPLTNPMTPSNPVTPGPATPSAPGGQNPHQQDTSNTGHSNMDINQGGNGGGGGGSMSLPPCSPHTPQFQQRPDAPLTPGSSLTPGGTPNGLNPNAINAKINGADLSLPPDTMDMGFLNQTGRVGPGDPGSGMNHQGGPPGGGMHPAMNMNAYNQPRMSHPGLHHMGMSQPSRFPMHQNMGIPGMGTNPNMSAYGHHPQQWAAYGGPGNGPRGY